MAPVSRRFDIWRLEDPLRRLCGLSGRMPDPAGVEFIREEDGNLSMRFLPEEELQAQFIAWHQEPRRAHLIHESLRRLSRAGHEVGSAASFIVSRDWRKAPLSGLFSIIPGGPAIQRIRAGRRLKKATVLFVDSDYIHPLEGDHFEGYIDLGRGVYFPICLATSDLPQKIFAPPSTGDSAICLPPDMLLLDCKVITPQVVERAVAELYMRRFRFTPGHWSNLSQSPPRVVLRASFEKLA